MDVIIRSICDRLLADTTLVGLVGPRIYPAHISTYTEVTYPCVTIFRTPGVKETYAPVRTFDILVSSWATTPDDAWAIFERVQTLLDGIGAVPASGVVYETQVVSTPYEMPDPDSAERVTQVIVRIEVRHFGS